MSKRKKPESFFINYFLFCFCKGFSSQKHSTQTARLPVLFLDTWDDLKGIVIQYPDSPRTLEITGLLTGASTIKYIPAVIVAVL